MTHFLAFGVFFALVALIYLRWPKWTYLSLIPLAIGFGFVAGPVPFRNLIEGMFGFLPSILIVATGAILVAVLQETGALRKLMAGWAATVHGSRFLAILGVMALGLIPGMFIGSGLVAYAVLTVVMLPVLEEMGLTGSKARAIMISSATLGMISPPVNVPLMIINGANFLPVNGALQLLWFVSLPALLIIAAYFAATTGDKYSPRTSDSSAGVRPDDLVALGLAGILFLFRELFPKSGLGAMGLALILFSCALFGWLFYRNRRGNFFSVSEKGVGWVVQIMLLLAACSVVLHISQFAGTQNYLTVSAKELSFALAIGLICVGALVLGMMWEGLAGLVLVSVYTAKIVPAYYGALVSSSAILTAFAAAMLCTGAMLTLGWRRTVLETGPADNSLGRDKYIPFLIVLVATQSFFWIIRAITGSGQG